MTDKIFYIFSVIIIGVYAALTLLVVVGSLGLPVKDTVSMLSDTAVGSAALIAAYFGSAGLSAWRKELTGKSQFRAAEAILGAAKSLHDELTYLRQPFKPIESLSHEWWESALKPAIEARNELVLGRRKAFV